MVCEQPGNHIQSHGFSWSNTDLPKLRSNAVYTTNKKDTNRTWWAPVTSGCPRGNRSLLRSQGWQGMHFPKLCSPGEALEMQQIRNLEMCVLGSLHKRFLENNTRPESPYSFPQISYMVTYSLWEHTNFPGQTALGLKSFPLPLSQCRCHPGQEQAGKDWRFYRASSYWKHILHKSSVCLWHGNSEKPRQCL